MSLTGYILETVAFMISLAYNFRSSFPFTTYGETAFIAVQNVLILLLILHYSGKDTHALGGFGIVLAFVYALFEPKLVSYKHLQILQGLSVPLGLASKVPQILENYQNGSTGQLSAVTVFSFVAGSAARIFTTMTEVDDPMIFWGTVLAASLNFVLAAQVVYYWGSVTKNAPAKSIVTEKARPQTPQPKTQKIPKTPTTPKGVPKSEKTTTPRSPKTPSRKGKGKKKS